jgi:hypothetical protein
MISVLRSVVNPGVGLRRTIENWNSISAQLRERQRKRTRQIDRLYQL